MTQRYTEIPSSQKIAESLSLLLNNDKTALSCSSGSAFPTNNLQVGMLCYRTDENKLYGLKNLDDSEGEWICVADLSGNFRHLDGGQGNTIPYSAKDLNLWEKMPTGFYEGSHMLNSPEGDSMWRIMHVRTGNSDGWATQMAFACNSDIIMTRFQKGGTWSPWKQIFSASVDGTTISGMNAEKIGGREAGNEPSNVAVNNGEVNVTLNADLLDGYHAGNETGKIPLSNKEVNKNLNADLLDGYHAGHEVGEIPVSDGGLNKNLNAEKISGFTIDEIVTRQNGVSKAPELLAEKLRVTTPNATDIPINTYPSRNTMTADHYETLIASNTDGKWDKTVDLGGTGDLNPTRYRHYLKRLWTSDGEYNLEDMVRTLVQHAHSHQYVKETYRTNCNCDCRCDCYCDCSDDGGCA